MKPLQMKPMSSQGVHALCADVMYQPAVIQTLQVSLFVLFCIQILQLSLGKSVDKSFSIRYFDNFKQSSFVNSNSKIYQQPSWGLDSDYEDTSHLLLMMSVMMCLVLFWPLLFCSVSFLWLIDLTRSYSHKDTIYTCYDSVMRTCNACSRLSLLSLLSPVVLAAFYLWCGFSFIK